MLVSSTEVESSTFDLIVVVVLLTDLEMALKTDLMSIKKGTRDTNKRSTRLNQHHTFHNNTPSHRFN